ncbi:MAG: mitochondrial fission ELM1 family protein [Pseudomonadota bacterium]
MAVVGKSRPVCWVVTDGRAGIKTQALGLAEALARLRPLDIVDKRISIRAPFRSLPRVFWGNPFSRLDADGALLRAPYPDLWIGCGRLSVPLSMAMRRRAPATFTVQLQAPRAPLDRFDLVISPAHDHVRGGNVIETLGALNRLTDAALDAQGKRLAPELTHIPSPRIAVLVGGPVKGAKLDAHSADSVIDALTTLASAGFGLLITPSRRTPVTLKEKLDQFAAAQASAFLWRGQPIAGLDNPYQALLGLSDLVLVTSDSVNMVSEAASTGKSLLLLKWPAPKKFDAFYNALMERGLAQWFSPPYAVDAFKAATGANPDPLNETRRVAQLVLDRWDGRKAG